MPGTVGLGVQRGLASPSLVVAASAAAATDLTASQQHSRAAVGLQHEQRSAQSAACVRIHGKQQCLSAAAVALTPLERPRCGCGCSSFRAARLI
jgi:hypothetical protein